MQNSSHNKTFLLFIILFAVPLGPMATSIFTPSMPAIATAFSTSVSMAQVTIPVFLLAYAIGQLVYGTISDALGRKWITIFGLVIFLIGCIIAFLSISIHMLLAALFLQGLGVASSSVLTKAMLGDCFKGVELSKASSMLTLLWAFSPIVAPAIGGYLQHYFGWKANFYALTCYSLACIILLTGLLPETLATKRPLVISNLVKDYQHILSSKLFLLNIVCISTAYTVVAAFNVFAPFLIQKLLGYSVITYGHIALLIGLALLAGSIANRLLAPKIGVNKSYKIAVWCHFFGSILMFLFAIFGYFTLTAIIVPTLIIVFFSGIIFATALAKGVGMFPDKAGSATALMSFALLLIASLITFIISFVKVTSQQPLAVIYIVLSGLALIAYLLSGESKSNKETS